MRSQTGSMLAVLALAGLMGCHGSGRGVVPQRVQRVPDWPPPLVGKSVPNPIPDPRRPGGASLANEINGLEDLPASPGVTPQPQPQVRFKPVIPNRPQEQNPDNGTGAKLDSGDLPPPQVVPPRNDGASAGNSEPKSFGPSLGFETLVTPHDSALSVDVRGQRQRPLGGTATFDVVVRNNGTETINGVLVNAEFDETLVFPGRIEKRLKRDLGQLSPGQSRDMRLKLTSNQLGRQSCRFSVTAEGVAAIEQAVTVEFINPKLQVDLVGPARRTVGSRAEFTVKIANTSDKPIDDLQVTLQHDAALTPHIASGGFQKVEHSLRWSLGRLEAGAGLQVQAEFDCRQLSEQACVTAEAHSENVSAESVESCLTVVAVPGLLDVRVSDRSDPVQVGKEAEFEITVQNLSLESVSKVQLDVQTSEHLRVGTHSAKIGEREVKLTVSQRNGTLRLELPESLPADATLRITLRATALQSGDAELRVVATPGSDGIPAESSEFTSINP
ncbi:MAG: hypothetical protein ACKV2Q_28895 [Planctomycetaceae bacterium]